MLFYGRQKPIRMCLVLLSWQRDSRYPLIVAGNRDERFERPTAALDWWQDQPDVLAGRDLVAGGTWLGVHRNGRFGIITNVRDPAAATAPASRGTLITDWLNSAISAAEFATALAARRDDYAGFNLLYGDAGQLNYYSNRSARSGPLAAGVYALSNASLDTPWPKVERARAHMQRVVGADTPDLDAFLPFLTDRTPAADDELPLPSLPLAQRRVLSAPFIVGEHYGTRCSTVLRVAADGAVLAEEQSFAPLGAATGRQRLEFRAG